MPSLTRMCINQFIDRFRNPVTSTRAQEIRSRKVMGRNGNFKGKVYYLHTDDCDPLVL